MMKGSKKGYEGKSKPRKGTNGMGGGPARKQSTNYGKSANVKESSAKSFA